MSDPDNFLARWSRRKREAVNELDDAQAPPQDVAEPQRARDGDRSEHGARPAAESREPLFDLESLPPIESITAETDIRPFLAPGVPAELTRAALRRVWLADPKIRDFVGLADYDWDFNAPETITGFGPLEMTDDVRRQIARIVGRAFEGVQPPDAEPAAGAPQPAPSPEESEARTALPAPPVEPAITPQGQDKPVNGQAEASIPSDPPQRSKVDIAAQHEPEKRENLQSIAKRNHGGALPK
jgi:hypothetical protein